MSWAAQYVGIPWVAGESDCYHFAVRVWREQFGWSLPSYQDIDPSDRLRSNRKFARELEASKALWVPVSAPRDGDAVLMGKGRFPTHVGIWVESERAVLHSLETAGVVCTPLSSLPSVGMRVYGYYSRKAA